MPQLIRCALVGTGREDNPYRPPFPTAIVLRAVNVEMVDSPNPIGVCLVPDDVVPEPTPGEVTQTVNIPGIGTVAIGITPAYRQRIRDYLNRHYREHEGEYSPDAS
jgi:hypothetical protein